MTHKATLSWRRTGRDAPAGRLYHRRGADWVRIRGCRRASRIPPRSEVFGEQKAWILGRFFGIIGSGRAGRTTGKGDGSWHTT